jgi:methylmalonyl-CoA mutase cobalamin-binding subunit
LYLAERDRHAGLLNAQQEEFVVHATREIVEDFEVEGESPPTKDEPAAKSACVPAPPHAETTLRVLCIAVRDEADETAALMLARLLRTRGISVQVLSSRALASEIAERVSGEQVDVVVLSVMPPLGGRDGRYHCRRLRAEYADMPILVGLWSGADVDNAVPRFEAAGATLVVTSLSDALRAIQGIRDTAVVPSIPPARSAAG